MGAPWLSPAELAREARHDRAHGLAPIDDRPARAELAAEAEQDRAHERWLARHGDEAA